MKLYNIRSGTTNELNAQKYTIGIGISLGNKWFSPFNVANAIVWALPLTKDVVVYVADSIHAINLSVRNKISLDKALKKALSMGEKILNDIKNEVEKKISDTDRKRILCVRWNDFTNDSYRKQVVYLRSLYKYDKHFQNTIKNIIDQFLKKEERQFSDEDKVQFGYYILEEFPELLNRIEMINGYSCDAYMYPFDSELVEFVEQIQNGNIFPEITEKLLCTESKVFLEVR